MKNVPRTVLALYMRKWMQTCKREGTKGCLTQSFTNDAEYHIYISDFKMLTMITQRDSKFISTHTKLEILKIYQWNWCQVKDIHSSQESSECYHSQIYIQAEP